MPVSCIAYKTLMKKNMFFTFRFAINFLILFFLIAVFNLKIGIVNAATMENNYEGNVIEELRLKVPSDLREVWLEAEADIWQPWLEEQEGFLGREIFWNPNKEEALLLVNWENKKIWKNIEPEEVERIQKLFEENVKFKLKVDENPFNLIYGGELIKES